MSAERFAGPKQGQIFEAISRVMAAIGSVSKDGRNEQQRYAFRGIEQMYLAAHPAMVKHGVFCAPEVLERDVYRFEKTNDQGRTTTWIHVSLKVEHRFYASDGSFVSVTTWGEGLDNSDKATNKAMSGAMKYALIELFCVPTEDVQDADATSPETGMKRKPVAVTTEPFTRQSTLKQVTPSDVKDALIRVGGQTTDTPFPTVAHDASSVPAGEEFLSTVQRRELHAVFRKAVPEERKLDADNYFYDWLIKAGYEKNGEPSTGLIPASALADVKKKLNLYAKSL